MSRPKEMSLVGILTDSRKGIEFTHPDMVRRVIKQYADMKLLVTFKPLEMQRSSAQNRWLWGVAYLTISAWYAETQGEKISKEDIHSYVLQHVLEVGTKKKDILGKETLVTGINKTTSALSKGEFQEFKEKLQAHFSEMDCIIPDPIGSNTISEFIDD